MIARGSVSTVAQGLLEVTMPRLPLGQSVRVAGPHGWIRGRVVRCAQGATVVAPAHCEYVKPGAVVEEDRSAGAIVLGTAALGRAIDAAGRALDTNAALQGLHVSRDADSIAPHDRVPLDKPMWTGVRAIDAFLTIARGARVGIFGSPGAGKTTLLETIVHGVDADAVVLALIGERGREAQHWIARCDRRTTIICATSDRSASERIAAVETAFAHARALANRGLHVLLVVDSLARVAYALRERGTALGEPAGRGGYPASTFFELANLVERAGAFACGTISLVATVLSDGDERDPVSDSTRSLLDGHIVLSQTLSQAGRFPAIDVIASASRSMDAVVSERHRGAAGIVRRALAQLEATRELRSLGIEPSDRFARSAVLAEARIERLLRQGGRPVSPAEALGTLFETADTLEEPHGHQL